MTFLFVGERPSQLAAKIGATWQNGKLAGRTLRAALEACGVNPGSQQYLNLWTGPKPGPEDDANEARALAEVSRLVKEGYTVVGMGAIVCARLRAWDIPHIPIIHPAARGAIRKTERYHAHVRAALLG